MNVIKKNTKVNGGKYYKKKLSRDMINQIRLNKI